MINLKINHTGIMASNLGALVEGNVNSIRVKFIFSAEWDSLAKVAVFSNGAASISVSLSSDTCAIPWEVLTAPGELFVSVRGLGDNGNFVLCTENEFLGRVDKSFANGELVDAEEATPSIIDSLLADVAELKSSGVGGSGGGADGKSAYEIACDHGFEGTESQWLASLKGADGVNGTDGRNGVNGIDGRDGRDGVDGHTPVKGVDYFTADDIADIVSSVMNALPDGDEVSY